MVLPAPSPYSFSPLTTAPVVVANDNLTGEPIFTQLAKSIVPQLGQTGVSEIFPDETIEERVVRIEQHFEPTDTIFPVVEPGKPDLFLNDEEGFRTIRYVQPLYIRRSFTISHAEINYRIKPGTINERWNPGEQIQRKMTRVLKQQRLTWDVFRIMTLLGGINYTDSRTGVPVKAPAQIPIHNIWNYNVTSGYRGRNEASFFRSVIDTNAQEAPTSAGVPFTHPDAAIVDFFLRFSRWFSETNKCKITKAYIGPELRDVIVNNNEIKLSLGGYIPKWNVATGDRSPGPEGGLLVPSGGVGNRSLTGAISLGNNGDLLAIAGIPVMVVDLEFKDPVDGVIKRLWPKNKIVFVSEQDNDGTREMPGRTQYCISENSGGRPGLWTRTENETRIPAAPGMAVQIGNAGMPYLVYPHRVAHVNVATPQQINDRIGVPGDVYWGTF